MKKSLILFTIIAATLSTSAFASTYDTNISAFKTRADTIIKEVNNFKPSGTYDNQMAKYREIDMKIDKLDNDMDNYKDALELDYRNGKLKYTSLIVLESNLEDIEYAIEDLDDTLEYKIISNNKSTRNSNSMNTNMNSSYNRQSRGCDRQSTNNQSRTCNNNRYNFS